MEDLSRLAESSLWTVSQAAGATHARPAAMSAPGTDPAAPSADAGDGPRVQDITKPLSVTGWGRERDDSPWRRADGTAWADAEGDVPGRAPAGGWEQA
jgi:hypothetical protein